MAKCGLPASQWSMMSSSSLASPKLSVIFCPSPASHNAIVTILLTIIVIMIITIVIIIKMIIIIHLGLRVLAMLSLSSALSASHDTCQGCLLRLCLWLTASIVLLHVLRYACKQMREFGEIAAAWQLPQSGQSMPGAVSALCSLCTAAHIHM